MNKEIQKLLSSDKIDDLNKGLSKFESKGSIKELTLVLELLNSKNAEHLENRIVEIVGNIKVKESNSTIIDAILKAKKEKGKLNSLLQICWQSSLDFTQNLELFTEIFIEGDYITALEAFTVIENIWSDYSFAETHQQLLLDNLKDNLAGMDEHKLILAKELIVILEN